MQLEDKSGIGCDKCGLACRQDFTYFNLDIRRLVILGQRPDFRTCMRAPVAKSLDYCASCFDGLSGAVIENYKVYQNTKAFMCEVSRADLRPEKEYYLVDVQKVDVNTSRQPYVCVTCKKRSGEAKCTCGGTKFIRPAKVDIQKDIIQFFIHKSVYEAWSVHKPKPNDWDTKS